MSPQNTVVKFGPRVAEIDPVVWGTPANFNLSHLGSVTARQSSIGHQPNLVALNWGRHLYSSGRPSRWTLAHILVCHSFLVFVVRLRISQRQKKIGAWNFAFMLAYYPDRSSPLLVNIGSRGVTGAAALLPGWMAPVERLPLCMEWALGIGNGGVA